jgi:hypothetical protein
MGEHRGDTDLYADAGARIMEFYRQRIDERSKTGKERTLARRMDEIERKLRLAGLRAELYRIARSRKLSDETARRLVREIDLLEAGVGTMTKLSVSKLVNVRSVFESWVVLSALDALDTFISYCNPVPSHPNLTSIFLSI